MCGITGSISRTPVRGLDEALAAIRHRGPDAAGQWHGQAAGWHLGLGHVRLSILDLSDAANQPFLSSDGRCVLVYNGEIYNFAALRAELASAGHSFRTHSDTEVLLAAYRQWGIDCLRRFEGMFAFVLADLGRRRVLMARDPLGIKPLYYAHEPDQGRLAFGSEARALPPLLGRPLRPDPASFAEFLLNGFLYEPATGLLGVSKIGPGCFAEFDLDSGTLAHDRFYDPLGPGVSGDPEALEPLLRESMQLQCVADVPVGLFFSGGTDSTALAATAPRALEALYVEYGEEQAASDSAYALDVARHLGLNVSTIHHRPEDAGAEAILDAFSRVARGTEEPVSDYTYIASEAIAEHARERGFKVMLSGMGGDELFAGYPRHLLARHRNAARGARGVLSLAGRLLASRPAWAKKSERLVRFVREPDFASAYTSLVGYFSTDEVDALLGRRDSSSAFRERLARLLEPAGRRSALKQAMLLDRYGFLAHNLTVTDRSSMAHGVEVRVPLLTRDLAALGLALADRDLIRGSRAKLPLKRVVEPRLPSRLVHRPKVGFNPPLDGKIRALGAGLINDRLGGGPFSGVANADFARTIVDAHFSGRANNTYKIWQMLYFDEWLRGHAAGAALDPAPARDRFSVA